MIYITKKSVFCYNVNLSVKRWMYSHLFAIINVKYIPELKCFVTQYPFHQISDVFQYMVYYLGIKWEKFI